MPVCDLAIMLVAATTVPECARMARLLRRPLTRPVLLWQYAARRECLAWIILVSDLEVF
jgi:hypothetical protein